ncbi:MAG: 30S ribosomal protein S17 [Parcubacteria group bacterium GW2011_GWA2_38_13b]|nr:MAG: 30S ribosomal protein S17 [Parcubacteria group bacterium GW2011_GWA2_38_13b]
MEKNNNSIIKKRRLKGIVVSDKMDKTLVVRIDIFKKHSRYHKYFTVSKKFKVHDEENKYKIGDRVVVEECRPLSKGKRWTVKELINDIKQENIK